MGIYQQQYSAECLFIAMAAGSGTSHTAWPQLSVLARVRLDSRSGVEKHPAPGQHGRLQLPLPDDCRAGEGHERLGPSGPLEAADLQAGDFDSSGPRQAGQCCWDSAPGECTNLIGATPPFSDRRTVLPAVWWLVSVDIRAALGTLPPCSNRCSHCMAYYLLVGIVTCWAGFWGHA